MSTKRIQKVGEEMDSGRQNLDSIESEVRRRAYEIHLQHVDSGECALDDWLRAEQEILDLKLARIGEE